MGLKETTNRSVIQITQRAKTTDLDPGVMVAIQVIKNQLSVLQDSIAALQARGITPTDPTGALAGFSGIRQTLAQFVNGAGIKLYQGDILRRGAAAGEATTTTTAGDNAVIGPVWGDGRAIYLSATLLSYISTVAEIGSNVSVCQRGVTKVRVRTDSEPILIGDNLKALDVARYACRAKPTEPGIFARALEPLSANKSAAIDADVNPSLRFDNYPDGQNAVFKATYDTDGSVTGFSGLPLTEAWFQDAAMSIPIKIENYHYNISGMIISAIVSCYDVDGTGSHMINRTMEYVGEQLDKIIQDIS